MINSDYSHIILIQTIRNYTVVRIVDTENKLLVIN